MKLQKDLDDIEVECLNSSSSWAAFIRLSCDFCLSLIPPEQLGMSSSKGSELGIPARRT